MDELADRLPISLAALRVALVLFVLAWILGPYELRSAVPIWLVFLIALGLELHFLLGAFRPTRTQQPDRGPQVADRERYGYADDTGDLPLVPEGDEELWIPYSAETDDELDALIAEARAQREEEAAAAAVAAQERRVWPPVRRFLTGLGVIGVLVLTLWFVESRTGWDSLAVKYARSWRHASCGGGALLRRGFPHRGEASDDPLRRIPRLRGPCPARRRRRRRRRPPERCFDLYRLAFEGEVTSSQTARALAVLAHEAWHLRGVRDEGTTECYALQSGVEVGRRLGLSEGTARQMMRQQLTENALRGSGSLEYLVTPDCRNGGRLDLNPNLAQFP